MAETKNELLLTDKVLKKGSNKLIVSNNVSFLPQVAGVGGTVIMVGLEQMMFASVFAGVFALGTLVLLTNMFFRKEIFKSAYLQVHNMKLEKEQQSKIKKLKKSLSSEHAIGQIAAFERKAELFQKTLNKQLSESSFSYKRLLGAFDQVYLFGLSKIEKILDYEDNKNAIDELMLRKEIGQLEQKEVLKSFEEEKLKSLQIRLSIREDYDHKIEIILSENENALTKMDVLQESLTDLHKPQNIRIAMEELSTLATALSFEEKNPISLSSEEDNE
jgi:hypothetical protein